MISRSGTTMWWEPVTECMAEGVHADNVVKAMFPAFVFPSFAFPDTVPTRVASVWIGSRLRLDSNAQVLHLDSEDKIMACIAIGEGFHMVHNGCSSIEFPHCQHSTCTNAHRSSIASTIVDDASTRPEPFVACTADSHHVPHVVM